MNEFAPEARQHLGSELLGRPAQEDHIVQFYEDEDFLCDIVADFLAVGLQAQEPLVVIATEAHRTAFVTRLEARGFHVERALDSGRLLLLDARETLSQIMLRGMPDWRRFHDLIGGVLGKLAGGRRIRAYGEMVDLLWQDGNPQAAIELERHWNGIARLHSFSLLCAYAMNNFSSEADSDGFQHVCHAHSHVLPTETYTELGESDARLREVSLLQQRARALEGEVAHRRQIEKALTEALSLRDDFLSVASHELRTPLTALQLYMQSLDILTRDGDVRVQSRICKATRQVGRLAALVDQLLDVSHVGTGPLPLDKETFDLAELAREVAAGAELAAEQAGCRLQVLTESPVYGRWDRGRIEQIVTNLLANAIKYGNGKPIELLVKQAQRRAYVVVRDHGIGIASEDQSRIFERFERAAPRQNFGGLGLGLWISRHIAEAHGGAIRVDSSAGHGAIFTVELPV